MAIDNSVLVSGLRALFEAPQSSGYTDQATPFPLPQVGESGHEPILVNPEFWRGIPATLGGAAETALTQVGFVAPTFADKVAGTESQPFDADLLLMAAFVYGGGDTSLPAGWTHVSTQEDLDALGLTNDELAKMGLELDPGTGMLVSTEGTGFQAAVFIDGDGNVVAAYAGTDPASGADIITNADQATEQMEGQYITGMLLAAKLQENLPEGRSLVLTGHSLGGGIARGASVATGAPAVTFNAAGLSMTSMDIALGIRQYRFGEELDREAAFAEANGGNIRRVHVEGEVLTLVQEEYDALVEAAVRSPQVVIPGAVLMRIFTGESVDVLQILWNTNRPDYDLPVAIGAPVTLNPVTAGIGGTQVRSPLPLHGTAELQASLLAGVPSIQSRSDRPDGTVTLEIRYPVDASTVETVSVEFQDQESADAFEAGFKHTGERPPVDDPGVRVVGVTTTSLHSTEHGSFADLTAELGLHGVPNNLLINMLGGDPTSMVITRDANGLPISAEITYQAPDGSVVVVGMAFDADGKEIADERVVTWHVTPDEQQASLINQVWFPDSDSGPIVAGESYSIELTGEDMDDWLQMASDVHDQQGAGIYVSGDLLNGTGLDGQPGNPDPESVFLSNLFAQAGRGGPFAALAQLLQFAGDQPAPGTVLDANGEPVQP